MKSFEQKLVMLLADPQLTDAQFHDAARFLSGGHLYRALRAAEELRSHMRHLFRDGDEVDDELYGRLRGLLLTESKMKATDALRFLAQELDLDERFTSKVSFRQGIARLLENGEGSALLSAAERIRERLNANPLEHAWPLTGGKSETGSDNL